ncbi:FG-GAP repeat domain-containing protein [Streptomyces sp. NPDC085529]|uniref:FG-GAP repeat domain-containing protein n=1 Tax=Streptomyces sp. NPDC085529 TaxID=3365729 RepID=UPI0037D513D3
MRLRKALGSVGALLGSLAAALVLGAPVAQADTVSPGSAPPLRFVSYNMCGSGTMCKWAAGFTNKAKYDAVLKETEAAASGTATGWNADQIFLQEVCEYQFDTLAAKLAPKGFTGRYVTTRDFGAESGVCTKPTGDTESIVKSGTEGHYGMAVFVKGAVTEGKDLKLADATFDNEWVISPCLKSYTQWRATWACSVHLNWSKDTDEYRNKEAARLAAQAAVWQAAGTPVVLGGDFNGTPGTAMAANFYEPAAGGYDDPAVLGKGTFREVDETDEEFFSIEHYPTTCLSKGATRCRSGEPTFGDWRRKIDYIFVSSAHFKDVKASVSPRDVHATDHDTLRGSASWTDCGPAGAGGSLFRRDSGGALYRYAGRAGGLAAPCKVGVGWGTMSEITRDGTTLVASDTDGKLWRYPADPGTGTYSGSTRILAGTGGWQAMDTLLAPGDVDGDGKADLLARERATGTLWLYPGNGADGYGARTSIGGGWGMFDVLLAPGDFNGDGKADLIGRTPTGDLWLYKGTGGAPWYFDPRVQIGFAWDRYTALAAPGDIDGDGRADLIGRDGDNDVYLYKGDGAGSYAPAAKVGFGYPAGELLF